MSIFCGNRTSSPSDHPPTLGGATTNPQRSKGVVSFGVDPMRRNLNISRSCLRTRRPSRPNPVCMGSKQCHGARSCSPLTGATDEL